MSNNEPEKHVDEWLIHNYFDQLMHPDDIRTVESHLRTCLKCCEMADGIIKTEYNTPIYNPNSPYGRNIARYERKIRLKLQSNGSERELF